MSPKSLPSENTKKTVPRRAAGAAEKSSKNACLADFDTDSSRCCRPAARSVYIPSSGQTLVEARRVARSCKGRCSVLVIQIPIDCLGGGCSDASAGRGAVVPFWMSPTGRRFEAPHALRAVLATSSASPWHAKHAERERPMRPNADAFWLATIIDLPPPPILPKMWICWSFAGSACRSGCNGPSS